MVQEKIPDEDGRQRITLICYVYVFCSLQMCFQEKDFSFLFSNEDKKNEFVWNVTSIQLLS